MSTHTKGPWESIEDTDGSVLIKTQWSGSFRQIAVIPAEPKVNEYDWNNAHLIAAAPEMLEALNTLRDALAKDHYENVSVTWDVEIDLIDSIIAKARGEE